MQLESQRLFFEDRLNKLEEKSNLKLVDAQAKYEETEKENSKLKENFQQLTKEKTNLEKKYNTVNNNWICFFI